MFKATYVLYTHGGAGAQWFKTIGDDDIFEPLINIYIIPSLYRYDVI